jgi:phage terminase large subunit-like protein
MRTEAARAAAMPTALKDFLRYDLNVWVRSQAKWMPMDDWGLCAGNVPAHQLRDTLRGRPCYMGLDLAKTRDLSSLVLEFPPVDDDPLYYVLPFFFCPEDDILKRSRNDRVPYDTWADQGFLTPTPGNITDQNYILHRIGELTDEFAVKRLYYDRYGSDKIISDLQNEHGFTLEQKTHEAYGNPLIVKFGQGFLSMSAPMNDVLRLVLLHRYAHGNHPVLTWNMDNLIAASDPAGNIKPDKERSRERIDGAVALVMAHAGSMIHAPEQESVYKTRGILTL